MRPRRWSMAIAWSRISSKRISTSPYPFHWTQPLRLSVLDAPEARNVNTSSVSPLASVPTHLYDARLLGHWGVGEEHGDSGRFLVSHAGAVRPYRRPGPRLLCPLFSPARSGALCLLGGAGV